MNLLRIHKGNKYYIYDDQDRLIYIRDTFIPNGDISFVYDELGLLGFTYRNVDYIYKTDVQGNIIAILDKNGNTVVEYYYDAWGNYAINDTSNMGLGEINPFRYRGYFYDTDMGLYYLKTRYYDPEVGRFINMDGISYADSETLNGLNLYAYCNNNPVMNFDPEGHAWWKAALLIAAIATAAVVGAVLTVMSGGVAGAVIGGAAIGFATSATADLSSQVSTKGWDNVDYKQAWKEGGIGAAIGAVSGLFSFGASTVASTAGKSLGSAIGQASHIGSGIKFGKVFGESALSTLGSGIGNVVGSIAGATFGEYSAKKYLGKNYSFESDFDDTVKGELPGLIKTFIKWAL